jgi:hypothetical protein
MQQGRMSTTTQDGWSSADGASWLNARRALAGSRRDCQWTPRTTLGI